MLCQLLTKCMCHCGVQCKFAVYFSNNVRSRLTVTEQVAKIIPYGHLFWLLTRQRHMHKRVCLEPNRNNGKDAVQEMEDSG